MTQSRTMVGLGLGLLGMTVLVSVLVGIGYPERLGGLAEMAEVFSIDSNAGASAQQVSVAVMKDLSVLGLAALGQGVLGLGFGLILAARVGAPLRGLVASMRRLSVFLLAVMGLVFLQAHDADSLGAVDPRLITAALLALAAWPIPATRVCAAAESLGSTAYYRSARELGVNAVTRCTRHVLPALWQPLLAAVALGSIHMTGVLFTVGFLGVAMPNPPAGLGGLLRQGYEGFDPSTPAGFLIPATVMTMILLALALLREGLRE